jgi:hypothetical protein
MLTGILVPRCQNPRTPHPSGRDCHPRGSRAAGRSPTRYRGRGRIQAWTAACLLIASGRERKGRGRGRGRSAVKEMLDVRLRAPVVDNTMNREYTSRRKGGRGLGRSRQSSGRGQTVIIVEDDGRESTSRKPTRTTNPPPPFLFHVPFPAIRPASPPGSCQLTPGDASSILPSPFSNAWALSPSGTNKRSLLEDKPRSSSGSKETVGRALTE